MKIRKKLFFYKINKKKQKKLGMKCFVHLRLCRHSCRILKTL